MNKDTFHEAIDQFHMLPGTITERSTPDFTALLQSAEAGKHKNIVYAWRCAKPISRLQGASDILYIGRTRQSFAARYARPEKWINSTANRIKYEYVLANHGPIRIAVCEYQRFGDTIEQAEGQLLWWYFQNHCEYPPFNYTQTRVRSESYPAIDHD